MYFTKPWVALRSLGLIAAVLLTGGAVDAQIVWNFTDGTFTASSVPANLTVTTLVAHNVGNGTASINATSANGSDANNLAMSATAGALNLTTSSYYEFTITAAEGFRVMTNSLAIDTRSSGTGPNLVSLYFVQPTGSPSYDNPESITVSVSSFWQTKEFYGNRTIVSGLDSSLTFRIYGSGGTSSPSAANWRIDDINLAASAITDAEFAALFPAPVPEPADYAAVFGVVSLVAIAVVRAKRRRKIG